MFGARPGDLKRFADLATPSFFDVVPAKVLWSQGRELLASMRDTDSFARRLGEIGVVLRQWDVAVDVEGSETPPADPEVTVDPHWHGQQVLQLYFAQLGHLDAAALDLRPSRFCAAPTLEGDVRLRWHPRPLSVTWAPEFIAGIRGLYAGFYRDDPVLFERSAHDLGLSAATDLFRQHFGEDDPSAVEFDLDRFKDHFHQIFVRCREQGARLHPNFVALGIYLGSLYEHLDGLGVPLNVRAAFDAVWPSPDAAPRLH